MRLWRREPAPVAEPDEDHVADGRGHESREEHRQQERSHLEPALDHEHPADDRPAEQRRDRRERAGRRDHGLLLLAELHEPRDEHPGDRSERDQRRLRAEHRPERERADRRQRDPGPVRDRDVGRRRSPGAASGRRRPGRTARATTTTTAPTAGRPITRYHGGDESPSALGRSSQSQCSRSCTNARNTAASRAAGIPTSAPSSDQAQVGGAAQLRRRRAHRALTFDAGGPSLPAAGREARGLPAGLLRLGQRAVRARADAVVGRVAEALALHLRQDGPAVVARLDADVRAVGAREDELVGGTCRVPRGRVVVIGHRLLGLRDRSVGSGEVAGGLAGLLAREDPARDHVRVEDVAGRLVASRVVAVELAEVPVQVDVAHHRVVLVGRPRRRSTGRWARSRRRSPSRSRRAGGSSRSGGRLVDLGRRQAVAGVDDARRDEAEDEALRPVDAVVVRVAEEPGAAMSSVVA